MSWLADKRITVTGGAGFLGPYVVRRLRSLGCRDAFVPRSADYDLTRMEDVVRMYEHARPDVVIHMAAKASGIGYIKDRPGEFFYDNLMMGAQVMEQGRRCGLDKLVAIATVCSYPRDAPVPLREEDLWCGYPEETNAPYGLAKQMLVVQAQAYRRQYGLNAVCLLPANLYGPGDNFELDSSHVIPALIRKCLEAVETGADTIESWGTGTPSREFLYAEDAAEAIVSATERYDGAEPINIGTGEEVTIRELAEMITKLTGFRGRIVWNSSKPDGQPRRCLNTERAKLEMGFSATTTLQVGLENTIRWYRENRARVSAQADCA